LDCVAGERFLAHHMLARLERGDGEWHVQGGGHAEVHKIHIGILQQGVEFLIDAEFAAEVEGIGTMDVTADPRDDAVDRLAHRVANRQDPRSLDPLVSPEVGDAHEAEANNRDVDLGWGILPRVHAA
jgi:hypothetical protein